jgi:hypothetical protein
VDGAPDWQRVVTGPGGGSVGSGYASLTGAGELTTPGALTQLGGFTVTDHSDGGVTLQETGIAQIAITTVDTEIDIVTGVGPLAKIKVQAGADLDLSAAGDINLVTANVVQIGSQINLDTLLINIAGGAFAQLGFYGNPGAQIQSITGALSTVADPAAQAVLTSIIAALAVAHGVGLVLDTTT